MLIFDNILNLGYNSIYMNSEVLYMNGIESIINKIDTMGVSAENLIYHILE